MTADQTIAGTCVLVEERDVDTDQIMPKQFCLRINRTGYEDALFFEWRKSPGSQFNSARARNSPILVAGPNFGCGSSREHAVWGLLDFGFRAVIAPSFGDTFLANCGTAGLVAATMETGTHSALVEILRVDPEARFGLDVAGQVLLALDKPEIGEMPVSILPFHRHLHARGTTELTLALSLDGPIRSYEAARPAWMPRVVVPANRPAIEN